MAGKSIGKGTLAQWWYALRKLKLPKSSEYTYLPLMLLIGSLTLTSSSPINRQAGISENVYITFQNDTSGVEQRVCSIDSMTYEDGESIPTSSPCEHCICRPPGFACTIISCEYRPGCKAIKRSNQCCPEYQCECEKDGKIYQNGEKILDDNNPCEVCYCQGGDVICAVIDCYWRSDCQPRYIENRCCPLYDHCPPPSDLGPIRPTHRPTTTTTVSTPISWFNMSSSIYATPTTKKPYLSLTNQHTEEPIDKVSEVEPVPQELPPPSVPEDTVAPISQGYPASASEGSAAPISQELPSFVPENVPGHILQELAVTDSEMVPVPVSVQEHAHAHISQEIPVNAQENSAEPISQEIPVNAQENSAEPISQEIPVSAPDNAAKPISQEIPVSAQDNAAEPISQEIPVSAQDNAAEPTSQEIPVRVQAAVLAPNAEELPVFAQEPPVSVPLEVLEPNSQEHPISDPVEIPAPALHELPVSGQQEIPAPALSELPDSIPNDVPVPASGDSLATIVHPTLELVQSSEEPAGVQQVISDSPAHESPVSGVSPEMALEPITPDSVPVEVQQEESSDSVSSNSGSGSGQADVSHHSVVLEEVHVPELQLDAQVPDTPVQVPAQESNVVPQATEEATHVPAEESNPVPDVSEHSVPGPAQESNPLTQLPEEPAVVPTHENNVVPQVPGQPNQVPSQASQVIAQVRETPAPSTAVPVAQTPDLGADKVFQPASAANFVSSSQEESSGVREQSISTSETQVPTSPSIPAGSPVLEDVQQELPQPVIQEVSITVADKPSVAHPQEVSQSLSVEIPDPLPQDLSDPQVQEVPVPPVQEEGTIQTMQQISEAQPEVPAATHAPVVVAIFPEYLDASPHHQTISEAHDSSIMIAHHSLEDNNSEASPESASTPVEANPSVPIPGAVLVSVSEEEIPVSAPVPVQENEPVPAEIIPEQNSVSNEIPMLDQKVSAPDVNEPFIVDEPLPVVSESQSEVLEQSTETIVPTTAGTLQSTPEAPTSNENTVPIEDAQDEPIQEISPTVSSSEIPPGVLESSQTYIIDPATLTPAEIITVTPTRPLDSFVTILPTYTVAHSEQLQTEDGVSNQIQPSTTIIASQPSLVVIGEIPVEESGNDEAVPSAIGTTTDSPIVPDAVEPINFPVETPLEVIMETLTDQAVVTTEVPVGYLPNSDPVVPEVTVKAQLTEIPVEPAAKEASPPAESEPVPSADEESEVGTTNGPLESGILLDHVSEASTSQPERIQAPPAIVVESAEAPSAESKYPEIEGSTMQALPIPYEPQTAYGVQKPSQVLEPPIYDFAENQIPVDSVRPIDELEPSHILVPPQEGPVQLVIMSQTKPIEVLPAQPDTADQSVSFASDEAVGELLSDDKIPVILVDIDTGNTDSPITFDSFVSNAQQSVSQSASESTTQVSIEPEPAVNVSATHAEGGFVKVPLLDDSPTSAQSTTEKKEEVPEPIVESEALADEPITNLPPSVKVPEPVVEYESQADEPATNQPHSTVETASFNDQVVGEAEVSTETSISHEEPVKLSYPARPETLVPVFDEKPGNDLGPIPETTLSPVQTENVPSDEPEVELLSDDPQQLNAEISTEQPVSITSPAPGVQQDVPESEQGPIPNDHEYHPLATVLKQTTPSSPATTEESEETTEVPTEDSKYRLDLSIFDDEGTKDTVTHEPADDESKDSVTYAPINDEPIDLVTHAPVDDESKESVTISRADDELKDVVTEAPVSEESKYSVTHAPTNDEPIEPVTHAPVDDESKESVTLSRADDESKESVTLSIADDESKESVTLSRADDDSKESVTLSRADDESKESVTLSRADDESKESVTLSRADDDSKESVTLSRADDDSKESVTLSRADDESKKSVTLSRADDESKESVTLSRADDESKESVTLSRADDGPKDAVTDAPVNDALNEFVTHAPTNDEPIDPVTHAPVDDESKESVTLSRADDESQDSVTNAPANDEPSDPVTHIPANDESKDSVTLSRANNESEDAATHAPTNEEPKIHAVETTPASISHANEYEVVFDEVPVPVEPEVKPVSDAVEVPTTVPPAERLDLSIERHHLPGPVEGVTQASSEAVAMGTPERIDLIQDLPKHHVPSYVEGVTEEVPEAATERLVLLQDLQRHHLPGHVQDATESLQEAQTTQEALSYADNSLHVEEGAPLSETTPDPAPTALPVAAEPAPSPSPQRPLKISPKFRIPSHLVKKLEPISDDLENFSRSDLSVRGEADNEVADTDETWFWRTLNRIRTMSGLFPAAPPSSSRKPRSTESKDGKKEKRKKVSGTAEKAEPKKYLAFPRFLLW